MGAWDLFKEGIFWVIEWNHSWCGDWGLAIIIITIMFRILIFPITRKQFKSSYQMQKLKPRMDEIKEKYADDPQRQQQETAKLYQDAKFNPLAGCLPMLLQMPIFIALYQTLLDLPNLIGAEQSASFYWLVPDLTVSAGTVFGGENGFFAVIPYAIMLLLFGGSLLIPTLLQRTAQDSTTKTMMLVMAVVMLFFGWSVPAGVLLYWDVSSYIGVGQQIVSRKLMERKDKREEEENIEVAPVRVEVDRVERKARPKKKSR